MHLMTNMENKAVRHSKAVRCSDSTEYLSCNQKTPPIEIFAQNATLKILKSKQL